MTNIYKTLWCALLSLLLCQPQLGFGRDVRFEDKCDEGEALCANHPFDCIYTCVYDRDSGELITPVSRLVVETQSKDGTRSVVEGLKDCTKRDALEKRLEKIFGEAVPTGEEISCKVDSDEWKGTRVQYRLTHVTENVCTEADSQLKELAADCQNWKTTWIGVGIMTGLVVAGLLSTCLCCAGGVGIYAACTKKAYGAACSECLEIFRKA